ncbi:MAG: hypothetical protein QOE20_3379 [Mycobacterium sp.]|jgi:hypothetical protein|nr:hypothetical protein [Mycobacterium sp.]
MTRARTAFGAEFLGAEGFLNSPTYGLPPTFLTDELRDCIGAWQAGTMDAPSFDEPVRRGRAGYAALAGVPVESVVMGGSVSAVLGLVAQAGRGVTVTELTADELVAAASGYDGVIASVVQSANGHVLDVDALRDAVAGTNTLVVLDVTQSMGWKQLDLGWADVTATAVYKWLLAPRGTAWMSLSERVSGLMTPHAANWYGARSRGRRSTGRRCGSPRVRAGSTRRRPGSGPWARG